MTFTLQLELYEFLGRGYINQYQVLIFSKWVTNTIIHYHLALRSEPKSCVKTAYLVTLFVHQAAHKHISLTYTQHVYT